MFMTRLLLTMRKLLKYAGMTNLCYFGEHWPCVTRLWCNFCFLIDYPSTYLHFITEEEELRLPQSDSLFKTQHQSHFDLSYLFDSQVNISRSITIFIDSHFAVIFVSYSPIPQQWAMSSWSQLKSFLCPASRVEPVKFAMNTFFCTGQECGGIFFYDRLPILFPSIINVLENGSLFCVWYPSKKILGILSNYICLGQRGFTKIKREFVLHLLHTSLKYRVTDQECCKQKIIFFLRQQCSQKMESSQNG